MMAPDDKYDLGSTDGASYISLVKDSDLAFNKE